MSSALDNTAGSGGEPELPGTGAPQNQTASAVDTAPQPLQTSQKETVGDTEIPKSEQNESTESAGATSVLAGPPVALPVTMPVPVEISAAEPQGQTVPDVPDAPTGATSELSLAADTASTVSDPMEADVSEPQAGRML